MNTFSNTPLQRKRFSSRGGVISVIISFLLGFVFAFVAVAGTIYILVSSITVKDGIEKVGSLTGAQINYEDYISEDYAEKTLLQLFKDDVPGLVAKAGNQTLTLNDLDAISPFIGTKTAEIADLLQKDYGISIQSNELMATSLSGMGAYLGDTMKSVDLGKLLSAPKINIMVEESGNYDLLMALCYGDASHYDIVDGVVVMKEGYASTKIGDFMDDAMGVLEKAPLDKVLSANADSDVIMLALCYGSDYEIVDGKIVLPDGKLSTTLGDLINTPSDVLSEVELGTIMQLNGDSDAITLALAYGKKGVDYDVNAANKIIPIEGGKKPTTIGDLTGDNAQFFDDLKNNLTLGELLTVDENSSQVMQSLKDKTLNELTQADTINNLKLSDLLEIDENSSQIMQALKDKTVDDLTKPETINNLKLGDILEIDENSSQIMQTLKDKTVSELTKDETINNLTLGELLEIDETDPNTSKFLIALKDTTVEDLGKQETIDDLKLGDLLEINSSSSKILIALQDKKVSDLNNQDTINTLKLGDIIEIGSSSSKILIALQDKTVADLNNQDTINNLKLKDILEINPSSSKILQALAENTVADLGDQETINNLKLGDIIEIDPASSSKILVALQDKTVADLNNQETINNLKLGDLLEIDPVSSSKILVALQDKTVADLNNQDTINNLKLKDVMNIDGSSPRIIQKMAEWTVADLSGSGAKNIEEDLTLTDILGDSAMTGNILGNLRDSTISSLATDINNLTVQDVMGDEIYKADGVTLKGTWKYLLQDKTTGVEGHYKITEMSAMIDNMTYNMQKASINDLYNDGIISVDSSFCTQAIMYEYSVYGLTIFSFTASGKEKYTDEHGNVKTEIGQLTVSEMLDYLSYVLGKMSA